MPDIVQQVSAAVSTAQAEVKKTVEERVADLEAKLEKATKVLVALTGHSDPLSLG